MRCCRLEDYSNHFDEQKAIDDLNDYRQNGVKRSSRPLFTLIEHISISDLSLLDIGGGVGVIVFELLKRGISSVSFNDISPPYVHQFQKELERLKVEQKVDSRIGDFTDIHTSFDMADIVTLDKVICCYPDYKSLVAHSSAKARRWYLINIPRNNWWVFLSMRFDYYWQWCTRGSAFLTYLHPVKGIEEQLTGMGFKKVKENKQREWVALLFERESA